MGSLCRQEWTHDFQLGKGRSHFRMTQLPRSDIDKALFVDSRL